MPSETEVYGRNIWGSNTAPAHGASHDGFVQYPLFALNMTKRIKGIANSGGRINWWLMTAMGNWSEQFCFAGNMGHADTNNAASLQRVPLCFRVA